MPERRLFLVRHGIAEDVSKSGRDADRELTAEGRRKTRRAARGLRALGVQPTALLASPLVRARDGGDHRRLARLRARDLEGARLRDRP